MNIAYSMPAFMLCGGVVHHCFVIRRLVEKGHDVSIYAPFFKDIEILPPLPDSVKLIVHPGVNSNLYTLPSEKTPLQFLKGFKDLTIGISSMAADLPSDVDVIQATFYPNCYAAHKMRKKTGSKTALIQGIHIDPDIFLPMSYRKRYYRLWKKSPFKADRLLTVCESLKRKLEAKYNKPVSMVSNGVDEELLDGPAGDTNKAAEFLGTDGRPYMLYVGSITYRKGIDTMLEAFSSIRKSRPDMLLALVGKGNWEPWFSKLAADFGVGDYVKRAQGADRKTLRHLFDNASCFLFPSRAEGFGLPPLEAMARGCPVICTPCEGIKEYAKDGENCLLVSPENAGELTAAVLRILEDSDLKCALAEGGRKTARQYTWDRVADLTEQAMLDTLKQI